MSSQDKLLLKLKQSRMVSLQLQSSSHPLAVLSVYKRGIMVAGRLSASGYFVFGGEDMANQSPSHMKGSSGSI